jgi:hypothetical protein
VYSPQVLSVQCFFYHGLGCGISRHSLPDRCIGDLCSDFWGKREQLALRDRDGGFHGTFVHCPGYLQVVDVCVVVVVPCSPFGCGLHLSWDNTVSGIRN